MQSRRCRVVMTRWIESAELPSLRWKPYRCRCQCLPTVHLISSRIRLWSNLIVSRQTRTRRLNRMVRRTSKNKRWPIRDYSHNRSLTGMRWTYTGTFPWPTLSTWSSKLRRDSTQSTFRQTKSINWRSSSQKCSLSTLRWCWIHSTTLTHTAASSQVATAAVGVVWL